MKRYRSQIETHSSPSILTKVWKKMSRFFQGKQNSVGTPGMNESGTAYSKEYIADTNDQGKPESGGVETVRSESGHLRLGQYYIHNTIGHGSFSKVKLGVHMETGEKVALKMIPLKSLLESEDLRKSVFREIVIHRNVNHKSIACFRHVLLSKHYLTLVMEYVDGIELFSFLESRGHLDENMAGHIFHQLLDVLDYLHMNGVIHRDIKLENVLVLMDTQSKNAYPGIKLIDFGLATIILPRESNIETNEAIEVQHSQDLLYTGPWKNEWLDFETALTSSASLQLISAHASNSALELNIVDHQTSPLLSLESTSSGIFLQATEISPPMSPISKRSAPLALLATRCGSEEYAPPELLRGIPYSGDKSDIWSLGILLYVLVAGTFPFQSKPSNPVHSLLASICSGRIRWPTGPLAPLLSTHTKDLIYGMLRVIPKERFGSKEIRSSVWWQIHCAKCRCAYSCQDFEYKSENEE
jgi:serine/threonine protein kinase